MPALMLVITMFSGGSWRVTGGAALLAPILVGVVGAVAAAYARTASVALGLMAAEVLAIGSLFLPGGVFGALVLFGVGALGGWLGGLLVEDDEPLANVPGGERSLQRIAFGWGLAALVVALVLAGMSSSSPSSSPSSSSAAEDGRSRFAVYRYSPQPHADACMAASLAIQPTGGGVALSPRMGESVTKGAPLAFHVTHRVDDGGTVPVDLYVTVQPEGGAEPVYAGFVAQSADAKGKTTVSAWNGQRCGVADATTFTQAAEPGPYVAHALALSDGLAWSSAPVRFEVRQP